MLQILQESLNRVTSLEFELLLLNVLMALVLSGLVCLAYKLTYSGTAFSKKFMISLAMMTLVTTVIMNAITNNVALSLGLVGALSIIRFRAAVKDTRDATFIFWCVGVGICCGVSMYLEALIGSAVIFLLLLACGQVKKDGKYMLVVKTTRDAQAKAEQAVDAYFAKAARLRVRNATQEQGDLIFEISRRSVMNADKTRSASITETLLRIEGVRSVDLVQQTDDISR